MLSIKRALFQSNSLFHNNYHLLRTFCFATSKFASYKDVPIQRHQVETNFMRSSGPGGQSVNTTNSKAQVRINLNECQIMDGFILGNMKSKFKNFINKDNQLVVRCQIHKSQGSNLQQCLTKAKKMIYECSLVPEQRRYDIPSQSDQNKQKRLESKKKKGDVKSRRQNNKFDFY